MRRATLLVSALAVAAFSMAATAAEAASHRSKKNPMVVRVTPRSYLDAGRVVSVGSLSQYATVPRISSPAYSHVSGRFGGDTLPGFIGAGANPFGAVDYPAPGIFRR